MKQSCALASNVPRETTLRLEAFTDILLRWNKRINLISRADEGRFVERHLKDSIQLEPLMPPNAGRAIDFGSGGGFPGIVLAITTGVHFDLVEADMRKAAFLREAVRITGANASVHCARVEDISASAAPLITARAFASLPKILELAYRLLTPDAVLLLPKGKNVGQELTDARARWNMKIEKFPSNTDPGATILRLSEVTRG